MWNRRPGQPPGTRSTHGVLVLPTVRGTTTVSCHVRKLSALSTPRSALYSTGDSVPVQAPAITRSTGKTGGFMTRRRTSYCRRAGLLNCVTSGREMCGKCDTVVTSKVSLLEVTKQRPNITFLFLFISLFIL